MYVHHCPALALAQTVLTLVSVALSGKLKMDGKYCTMCTMRAVQLHSFNKPAPSYYPSLLCNNLKSESLSDLLYRSTLLVG